jgi:hypothetical protein
MSSEQRPPDDPTPPSRYPPGWTGPGLEERIEEEERRTVTNRQLAVVALSLAALLAVAVVALVVGLVALNRDVEAVSAAEPADESVGTAALQDGAVTAGKLAAGAVTADALADGAVATDALADGAVTNAKVAPDSLTGASIDESTLERVPSARNARNAANLGGVAASAYLSRVTFVQAQSDSNTDEAKGPVTASCPADTIVIAGGASLEGTTSGVAIVESAPADDQAGWAARAQAFAPPTVAWRLVVTAVCAAGGR